MMCNRCRSREALHPEEIAHFGSGVKCAFPDNGVFTTDNWMCATIVEAWYGQDDSSDGETKIGTVIYGQDESMVIFPVPDDWGFNGWVILNRYKRRGRTTSAIWVGDWESPKPVTYEIIDRALNRRNESGIQEKRIASKEEKET